MARRLVEAGVPFVEVVMGDGVGWDTHRDNFPRTRALSLECDTAMSALVEDLQQRGLLDTTLVVWMGEFGRTPQCTGGGRNHWSRAWSTVLIGGGIKGGQVVGRTDRDGAAVVDRPISVTDFLGTVCTILGIDYTRKNHPPGVDRPIPIVDTSKGVKVLSEFVVRTGTPRSAHPHQCVFDMSTQTSQAKLPSPIAKKSNGKPNRRLRLSQVDQVPQSLLTNGLSAPPTISLLGQAIELQGTEQCELNADQGRCTNQSKKEIMGVPSTWWGRISLSLRLYPLVFQFAQILRGIASTSRSWTRDLAKALPTERQSSADLDRFLLCGLGGFCTKNAHLGPDGTADAGA